MQAEPQELLTRTQKFFLLYISVFALLQIYCVGITNDTLNILFFAKHLAADGGLYQQWFEVNPPLIFFIYTIPYYIITLTGFTANVSVNLVTASFCLLSLYASHLVLKRSEYTKYQRYSLLLLQAWILFVLPIFFTIFGDRDHLLFVFTMPWFFTLICNVRAGNWISAMAAVGFCIKPYNALIFMVLVLFGPSTLPFKKRVFTRSNQIIIGIGLGYIAFVLLFFPGYWNAVKLVLSSYQEISWPISSKREPLLYAFGAAFLPLVFVTFKSARIWFTWLLACSLVYLLNGGWLYTRYLVAVPALCGYGFWLIGIFNDDPYSTKSTLTLKAANTFLLKFWNHGVFVAKKMFGSRIIPLFIFAAVSIYAVKVLKNNIDATNYTGYSTNYTGMHPMYLRDIRKELGEHFIFLGLDIWGSNLAELTHPPTHVFPYDYLWPLPKVYADPDSPNSQKIKDSLFRALKDSVRRYPDATIMVDRSPSVRSMPYKFDIMDFFMQDEDIRLILDRYTLVQRFDQCKNFRTERNCAFDIWKPTR